MRAPTRLRIVFSVLTLSAPLLLAGLAGCGGDDTSTPAQATVSEAEKASVSSYEAEIAKEKAAFKGGASTKHAGK